MSSVKFLVALVLSSLFSGAGAFTAFLPVQQQRQVQTWGVSSSSLSMAGPSILEREITKIGGGPAVLDRPSTQVEERVVDDPSKQRKNIGNEAWEVRIYNDGLNTREHVARSLVQVTGMTEMTAYQTMMQAHQNGIAVVGRFLYEIAEMYHDELRKNGIVCDLVPVEEER
jgi:ATP-dependent Clp protease adaptor protein ClpS